MHWIKPGFGVLLAALTMTLWSISFWGGDLAYLIYGNASQPGEAAILQSLDRNLSEGGVYRLPSQPLGDPVQVYQQTVQGPVGILYFAKEGIDPLSARSVIGGFLHLFVTALGLGVALCLVIRPGQRYSHRLGIVVLIGFVATVFARMGGPVWYLENLSFYVWYAFHDLVSYLLAGAILAMFIRHDDKPAG